MAKIKVTQIGSPIRRELEDSPEVRGMIRKVQHMVEVAE